MHRCGWARSALEIAYHDHEWGVPVHDERLLFEFLILEGAQAGLSWSTILAKRENYRRAFDNFEIAKVARYGDAKKKKLLSDAGIVRNRLKIESSVTNAQIALKIQKEPGGLATYLWSFVDGKPIRNAFKTMDDIPATTPESDRMSRDLKKRGFRFVGSTICYAFMQAVGMVNDHETRCFRYKHL